MNERDILTTERLVLRPVRMEDAPTIQRVFPHYEMVQYMAQIPWPYPARGAEHFLRDIALPFMQKGRHWVWAITTKGDDTLKGIVHLRRFEKTHRGFWLEPASHGKGIMTEAICATNDHAFGSLKFERLVTSHAVANAASRRIKQKTGAKLIGEDEETYVAGRLPCEIWELTKPDWIEWKKTGGAGG
jgi:RimJ/RimL family protein N-acetyltransferase